MNLNPKQHLKQTKEHKKTIVRLEHNFRMSRTFLDV